MPYHEDTNTITESDRRDSLDRPIVHWPHTVAADFGSSSQIHVNAATLSSLDHVTTLVALETLVPSCRLTLDKARLLASILEPQLAASDRTMVREREHHVSRPRYVNDIADDSYHTCILQLPYLSFGHCELSCHAVALVL